MIQNGYSNLVRNQQSISYNSSVPSSPDLLLQKYPEYRSSFYPNLLVDDLMYGIFPYEQNRDYTVKLEAEESNLKEVLLFALNSSDYYHNRNVKESVGRTPVFTLGLQS